MRVAFNAWHYIPGTLGGGETYILNLLKALRDVPEVDVVVLTTPLNDSVLSALGLACHRFPIPAKSRPARVAMEQALLPRVCRAQGADLLHTTANVAPLISRCPVVLTVHDLFYEHFARKFQSSYYRAFVPASVRRSAHVITVSENSRTDLLRKFHVPPDRVSLVYEAADEAFFDTDFDRAHLDEVRTRFGLRDEYVLYVGSGEPHKNVSGLMRGFARAASLRESHRLAVVGDMGAARKALIREAAELQIPDRVVFTGRVDFSDLLAIYRAAKVLVLPSFFEGFGLPIVEAMASGVPVISSDRTCLTEICGGAAILVDPSSDADIARALTSVLSDESLRRKLIALGRSRAREFSWSAAARGTVAAYQKALDERR